MNFAVKLAHAILDLEAERDMLARENARLQGIEDLLMGSIRHSQHMMNSILELAMKPGVLEAISNSNQEQTLTYKLYRLKATVINHIIDRGILSAEQVMTIATNCYNSEE